MLQNVNDVFFYNGFWRCVLQYSSATSRWQLQRYIRSPSLSLFQRHAHTHTLRGCGSFFSPKTMLLSPNWTVLVCHPSTVLCVEVSSLTCLFLLQWTVPLKTWMQLVSWKSGNTSTQMVRTVNDMISFCFFVLFTVNIPSFHFVHFLHKFLVI